MTPMLFDPLAADADAWPNARVVERAYIEGVAQLGAQGIASNVGTQWLALRLGERLFPVTANDARDRGSYVCLPHSAYALYARREIALMKLGIGGHLLSPMIAAAGGILQTAQINRIVHIDNWLLSTNLHGDWDGADLSTIRAMLAARFPRHILAVRSVDPWSAPALFAAIRADGWTLVPSRQLWVTDDLAADWRPRNAHDNDRRLLRKSGLTIETIIDLDNRDAVAIADLYHQLYIAKYSALNPAFTPAFVALTHAIGMIRYRVARASCGAIRAVAGSFERAGIATPPVVGYDRARPQSEGLYRIASWMFMDAALAAGHRLNGSSGAAHFKRLRGARGVIEYWAMDARHLSAPRRAAIAALSASLSRWAVPMMQRNGW